MPYREKTAWLSLITMAITYGPYFARVANLPPGSDAVPNFHELEIFAGASLSNAVLVGLGHLYLRFSSPQEARMKPDERDLAIMNRSMTAAYYVLLFGMIVVGCIMPFTSKGWSIVYNAIFALVLAEIVHYGVVVASYRRQA